MSGPSRSSAPSAGSGGATLTRTSVKTTAYTASAGDLVPVDPTGGAVTITLPSAPADKAQVEVKIVTATAPNAVTVACAGSDVFNRAGGATTMSLTVAGHGATYQYDAASHIWTVLSSDTPLTQLDARYPQKVADLRPIATHGARDSNGALSDGIKTGSNSLMRHKLLTDASTIRLVYANRYKASAGANVITVKAGVRRSNARTIPVYFNGSRSVVIPAGRYVVSDPIPLYQQAGTLFFSRTFVEPRDATGTLITSGKWPQLTPPNALGAWTEACSASNGETDKSTSGTISGTTEPAFMPVKIIAGNPVKPVSAFALIGDSIMAGAGDGTDLGFPMRAINDNFAYVSVPVVGEFAQLFQQIDQAFDRYELIDGCTHAICEYGINDINNGGTAGFSAPEIQAYMVTIWDNVLRAGMKAWQTTITPYTTSTDAWATLANQTQNAYNANRVTINNWLRDGAPINNASRAPMATGTSSTSAVRAGQVGHSLVGVLELADLVESSRDSGLWKVNGTANFYTNDGLHPNGVGHTAIAATLNFTTMAAT